MYIDVQRAATAAAVVRLEPLCFYLWVIPVEPAVSNLHIRVAKPVLELVGAGVLESPFEEQPHTIFCASTYLSPLTR